VLELPGLGGLTLLRDDLVRTGILEGQDAFCWSA
jgi:hypothetical protein